MLFRTDPLCQNHFSSNFARSHPFCSDQPTRRISSLSLSHHHQFSCSLRHCSVGTLCAHTTVTRLDQGWTSTYTQVPFVLLLAFLSSDIKHYYPFTHFSLIPFVQGPFSSLFSCFGLSPTIIMTLTDMTFDLTQNAPKATTSYKASEMDNKENFSMQSRDSRMPLCRWNVTLYMVL